MIHWGIQFKKGKGEDRKFRERGTERKNIGREMKRWMKRRKVCLNFREGSEDGCQLDGEEDMASLR